MYHYYSVYNSILSNMNTFYGQLDREVSDAAKQLVEALIAAGSTLTVAESCTGGLIAGAVTAIPGSSAAFERGFVVYSDASKSDELGVPPFLITEHGAVSEAVVVSMAEGALSRSGSNVSVAVTGVAGPTGSPDKPVGTVHLAVANRDLGGASHQKCSFESSGRDSVRRDTVLAALRLVTTSLVG